MARARSPRAGLTALSLTAVLAPAVASAASPQVRVNVPAKPVHAALIDLALQTQVSLGGDLFACRGRSEAVSGRMPLSEALRRVLAHSGCGYVIHDAATVVVTPRPRLPAFLQKLTAPPPRPPPSPLALGEVVITAPKSPELLGRTPYMVSTFTGATLERSRSSSLEDLTGQVAGMTVTNLGPGRDKILLRGLSDGAFTGEAQSTVALYLDDVPITYNAPDPDLRLADLERVEILRGPQGTLYGGGSIGGVVRLQTRKPDLDAYSATMIAGVSTTRGGGASYEVEAVGNLPIIAGRLALRGLIYSERQGGYIDNPALGARNTNVSSRMGMRLAAGLALSPNWTATAGFNLQSIDTADTQYGLRRLGPFARDNQVLEPHDNDFDQGYVTLVGAGEWGRIVASAAHLAHYFGSRYDASSALPRFGAPAGLAAFHELKETNLSLGEVTYSSPAGRRFHWLVGAFASNGQIGLEADLTALNAPSSDLYGETRSNLVRETAVYGEASYELTEKLSATAGLRIFAFRLTSRSTVLQGAGTRTIRETGEANGASPKVLLRYAASPDLTLYAQVAEGYRPGGFNTSGQIGQVYDAPGAPQRRYAADELWSRWFDDRLQVRLAAFQADWQSIQSDQYLPDGLLFTANVGSGSNQGLEIEAAWRAHERLDLKAAALLNNPEVTRLDENFAARIDAGLPGVPKISFSVAADYRRPLTADWTLRLQGQAAYTGASHLTFDGDENHRMGDYVTARLTASLESERWTLDAYVDNPADRTANSFTFGNPFRLAQDRQVTPLRPRTVGVRLTSRF